MQHLAKIEIQQRAIRANVCVQCSDRPTGSEAWPSNTIRSCETLCPIFVHLHKLDAIAQRVKAPTLDPYELEIREDVCQHCELSETAGDYCSARTTGQCQLSRYLPLVIDTLERVDQIHVAEV
jgi:hypothetical protein